MTKHPVVPLGEICEFAYGDGLKETDRNGGDVPVYGSNGIVGWHDQALTKGETIIVGRKGSIGEVHLSKNPCWPIDTTYYIEKTKEPCDLNWLYYALKALDLTRLNKSAAVPGLNREDAYEQKVVFPPLSEQKRIAALLARADRLRRLRRAARDLGEALLQSVFLEMFGDPLTNTKQWEIVKLEETFAIKPQIGTPNPAHIGGKYPVIRVGEIGDKKVELEKSQSITLEGKELERFRLKTGDFLLARAIGSEDHLGKASILQETNQTVVYDSHVMRLRFDPKIMLPVFFWHWLKSEGGRARFMQKAGRTAVQFNVNTEQIADINVPLPPLRERMAESERQVEGLFESLLSESFGR